MKTIEPTPVRTKVELSPAEVQEAIAMWLKKKHGKHLAGEITIVKSTGNQFRAIGELKLSSEFNAGMA